MFADNDCTYNDEKDMHYMGKKSIAAFNRVCLSWTVQRLYKGADFPDGDVTSAGSYCRNPKGARGQAFCYIPRIERKRTEFCELRNCCKSSIFLSCVNCVITQPDGHSVICFYGMPKASHCLWFLGLC
jgi:hypothetical protein